MGMCKIVTWLHDYNKVKKHKFFSSWDFNNELINILCNGPLYVLLQSSILSAFCY